MKSPALGLVLMAGGVLSCWAVDSVVARGQNHWAFQPVALTQPPPPARGPVGNVVDRFLLSKLETAGIPPAPPADKAALIRRASFDLVGLPPTPEETAVFLADESPSAFAKLVDRLLASPRYGERWGRHWMDVARYADTAGDNADYPVPELALYRDYIIDAFNADKPYDQFVEEQLAGDILATEGPKERLAEQIVATGFLALSRRYGTGPYELWHLTLENTIETVSQAFLGLNLRCARCHDHKFDPVSMRDYYGLYGVFASTQFPWAGSEEIQSKQFNRQHFAPLVPAPDAAIRVQAWQDQLRSLRDEIADLEKKANTNDAPAAKSEGRKGDSRLAQLKLTLRNLEKPGAPPDLPVAYAVHDGQPADTPLQRRGEPSSPGDLVPRCVPEFLAGSAPFRIAPGSSGRLELARWLTHPANPLVARVMVNRIWQGHFGQGLVLTPNNLGRSGAEPVHPELLDYLSARFIQDGWSVKALHRVIMNSAAYQRSSAAVAEGLLKDPANRWLWRFDRRRLDAESARDAILFASGILDLGRPGPHPFPGPEKWSWTQHTPFKECYESRHRSVYLMTQRLQRHPFIGLFDGPDTNSSTDARRTSTVPQQALFAMNSPFIEENARSLARRVVRARASDRERLDHLQALTWNRPPAPDELRERAAWLSKLMAAAREAGVPSDQCEEEAWIVCARVMLNANEFWYVD